MAAAQHVSAHLGSVSGNMVEFQMAKSMFFQDKVHKEDVIKWGVFAGILEGIYIVLAAILYAQRGTMTAIFASSDQVAMILLLTLVAISATITTIIVFAHPLHCFIRRHYLDALLTVAVTLLTMVLVLSFTMYAYRILFLS